MKAAYLLVAAIVLVPATAWAGHGQPGLWTITSSMKMANMPQIPPEALAAMKARGMKIPGSGEPVTTQMCMTQEQVNADKPVDMHLPDMNCTTKVLNQSASSISTETTCHGRMEGVGHSRTDYRGNTHYEGTYSFMGTMEGRPNEITTHYSGDFVKADCGDVKPFGPPPAH